MIKSFKFRFLHMLVCCICMLSIVSVQQACARTLNTRQMINLKLINQSGVKLCFSNIRSYWIWYAPSRIVIADKATKFWGTLSDFETANGNHNFTADIYSYDERSDSRPDGRWIGSITYENHPGDGNAVMYYRINIGGDHKLYNFAWTLPLKIGTSRFYRCDLTVKPNDGSEFHCHR